jgi:hypothetical protein
MDSIIVSLILKINNFFKALAMNPLSLLTFPFKLLWTILSFPISLISNVLGFVIHAAWSIVSFPFALGLNLLGNVANAVIGTFMAFIMFFVPHSSVEPSPTISASVSPSQAVAINSSPTSAIGYDVAPMENFPTVQKKEKLSQTSTNKTDEYIHFLHLIDPNREFFKKVEKGDTKGQIIITVTNDWLYQPYQIRKQNAEKLWSKWALTYSPGKPDSAYLKIVDFNGNKVGGSSVWGGSLVDVN